MKTETPDWSMIRERAAAFPEGAFAFVREGLAHTAATIHGVCEAEELEGLAEAFLAPSGHVSGQQLCMGLVDLARQRYGRMARFVLARWGINNTLDLGVIVYAMIDRGELRCADDDRLDDFRDVCDLDEALAPEREEAGPARD